VIRHYKDLVVYQQAYQAALDVSKLTRTFPRNEQFEVARPRSAGRAAARAIPANITESWARRESPAEFRSFASCASCASSASFILGLISPAGANR